MCFFQKKFGAIKRVIIKRSEIFKRALQCISKPCLVEDDSEVLIGFTILPLHTSTEDGKWLLRYDNSMSDNYKNSKKEEIIKGAKDRFSSSVSAPGFFSVKV